MSGISKALPMIALGDGPGGYGGPDFFIRLRTMYDRIRDKTTKRRDVGVIIWEDVLF